MKLRTSKKLCKRFIKESGYKILAVHNRTFVVVAPPSFICSIWYAYIVVSNQSPDLDKMIRIGKSPINDMKSLCHK